MFRAAYRSSSGAPNRISASGLYTHVVTDRCSDWVGTGTVVPTQSEHGYINQRLQIRFGAPDDERCAAQNMLSLQ
jgi:hypothetical protein